MREIKFRGLEKDGKQFRYGGIVIIQDRAWILIEIDLSDAKSFGWVEVDPGTIGQFTCLKDKNGKDIYEGDIIKIYEEGEETIASVVWGNEYPAFTLKPEIGAEYNELQHACLVASCEVIGNIYQNPELLING